jgi:hypothetical protein
MKEFEERGRTLRLAAKELVLEYLQASDVCQPGGEGERLSQIFRACGFDWGEHPNATSSNQQYWIVAAMRELESAGKVERVSKSGPWRLRR